MAIFVFPNENRTQAPPIASHPAFPWIIALWLAVLFGLGTFVLPPALVGRLMLASGAVSLVPALEPPLGLAARIAISAVAGLGGALAGFAAGRALVPASDAGASMPDVRPLNAREELGDFLAWDEPVVPGPEAGRSDLAADLWADHPGLAELVERLDRVIERRRAERLEPELAAPPRLPPVPAPESAPESAPIPAESDMDAALRAAMERLQQLRGAA